MTTIGKGQLDPRLHHPDGTHRESARSALGSDVTWFEEHFRQHLATHEERPDDRFRVEWKYVDNFLGNTEPTEFASRATYTLTEAEARVTLLRGQGCYDIRIVPSEGI